MIGATAGGDTIGAALKGSYSLNEKFGAYSFLTSLTYGLTSLVSLT